MVTQIRFLESRCLFPHCQCRNAQVCWPRLLFGWSGIAWLRRVSGPRSRSSIDSIQRLETELSRGLTADVDSAKRLARKRVAIVDDTQRKHVQQAATGLAKAMQYGIDRYPAVVFDAEAVVYGVADLKTALHRYRRWREASAQ